MASINFFVKTTVLALLLFFFFQRCTTPDSQAVVPTLFKLHSPEHTGIHFSNQLYEDENLNILTFEYFYNGAGVGTGDLNNDGLPDVFFSGNMEKSRLYINKGDFRFEDITGAAGINTEGRWVTGVSMVDINADGWLDIYLSCAGPYSPARRANLFYLNNQDGTFSEKAAALGLADTGHTTQAAFFDYDRDGDLDVYLLTNITEDVGPNVIRKKKLNGESPNTDRLYRNDEGRFVDVSRPAGISKEGYGLGVSIADVNLDGWPDIYVSNDYLSNDLLYINQRDGSFADRAADYFRHTSYSAMGNDVADFNNDGWPDIVTVDMLPPDNLRRKLMTGSINYDRFHSEMIMGYAPQYMRNTLQLHRGFAPDSSLVFSEIGQLAGIHSTDWSWSPLFSDIDNDSWKDLLITNGYPRDITNRDFASYKMNTLMQGRYDQEMKTSFLEALQHLDGAHLPNFAFRNRGDLTFEDASLKWGFTQAGYSHGATLADLDGDGDLDYIVNNTNHKAFIYENQSTGKHYLRIQLRGQGKNLAGLGTKVALRADGQWQYREFSPYRGFQSSVEPILHFGLGRASQADTLQVTWPDGRVQILSGVSADQTIIIDQRQAIPPKEQALKVTPAPLFREVTAELGLSYHHVEEHYADFKVQPLLPHKHSQQGPAIAVGDMNGDGREDFFIGGGFKHSGQLFFQGPEGNFHQRPLSEGDNYEEDLGCLLFDAEGDGDLDLYITSGGSEFPAGSPYYQDRLYKNDGRGNFQLDSEALPVMRTSSASVAAGDYDGDGDPDLFVGGRIAPNNYTEIPESYLLENQNGRFVKATSRWCPELSRIGRVSAALWTDVDGDRLPDLVVAGEWMPLIWFRNRGRSFEKMVISQSTGWWNSLAAADLDQDGDTDLVAGNLGRNNPYQGSSDAPLRLHLNDFDQNGRQDALMTFYLQGEEVPVHFRDDLLGWLYPLKKTYRSYQSYAEASWSDLFPSSLREKSKVLQTMQLSSVWVENDNGRFIIHSLPLEAQFAPVNGILVDDFNRDGYSDLLLAGNSFATETNTGYYDALNGLLLCGNPQKTFTPRGIDSGFYLPGDAKGLARIQLTDGRSLLLGPRNNDTMKAFLVLSPVQ